jgi:hypothetical protein
MPRITKTYETAAKRWEAVGPYYAMFPIRFADAVVAEYTDEGDSVLDPFAGRGTAIFSAAVSGRVGLGIEVSPVGWVYAKAKLGPAPLQDVIGRLEALGAAADEFADQAKSLPRFFHLCFSRDVRRFLLAARARLDWRRSRVDRTLMALLLVYLHGKRGQALSNQMRQTKAMSQQYAIDWWVKGGELPPEWAPVEFMRPRIEWRYEKGIAETDGSRVFLGDSKSRLNSIQKLVTAKSVSKPKLLLTSPPYYGVTNYHYDQWLRLWLLGFEPKAYVSRGKCQGRFTDQKGYKNLLTRVFAQASRLMHRDAVIYVRTSKEPFTRNATIAAVAAAFPRKQLTEKVRPFRKPTQTHLFGDKTPKRGEVDLILEP